MIAPIRTFKRHSVPLDVSPAKELIEAECAAFHDDIAALAKRVKRFDEAMDVAVPGEQAPVEPANIGSESWQYALLFPLWVRRTSSPMSSIGVPAAKSNSAKKFLT